jgi:hypothetical protein
MSNEQPPQHGAHASSREPSHGDVRPYRPNVAAFAVFVVAVGVSIFVLVFQDLRDNALAQVFAGVMMALAVSVILFSVVPSKAPVRAAVGLGGAALFYFLLWPQVEKAIHPPPSTTTLHGSLYFISAASDLGLRPVQGAEIGVANTSLKSSQKTDETGEFTVLDAPSDVKELEAYYGGQVYVIQLSKFPNTRRYAVIPAAAAVHTDPSAVELPEAYLVDATVEIRGSYWERKTVTLPDAHVSVPPVNYASDRQRVCAQPQGDFIVDSTNKEFRGGIRFLNSNGNGYHSVSVSDGCIDLYVDGRDGFANANASGISVALKRLVKDGECGTAQVTDARVSYAGVTQVPIAIGPNVSACLSPDVPTQPKWTTTVRFKRQDGSLADQITLQGFEQSHALNGAADVWMNSSGLLTIALKRS